MNVHFPMKSIECSYEQARFCQHDLSWTDTPLIMFPGFFFKIKLFLAQICENSVFYIYIFDITFHSFLSLKKTNPWKGVEMLKAKHLVIN